MASILKRQGALQKGLGYSGFGFRIAGCAAQRVIGDPNPRILGLFYASNRW
jgi:hypothetical protein